MEYQQPPGHLLPQTLAAQYWLMFIGGGSAGGIKVTTFFLLFFFIHVRWTPPRFRYDQVMDLLLQSGSALDGRVSFVAAGAGARVAKHGNRSI